MLHCLRYWPCRSRTRRLRSGSEWASAAMSLGHRSALTAITRIILMVARPTATTVRPGSRTGSSSAQVPGTTVLDVHITVARLIAAFTDMVPTGVVLRDVGLMDVVRRFGAASKGAVRAWASAEGPMAEGPMEEAGAAANPTYPNRTGN